MDNRKQLLDNILKIRRCEEKIVEVYHRDKSMRTPTHLSIGQEAISAGVCLAMNKDDQVFVGHRCHAAYLAKGGDIDGFFAELCGRATGVCQGRAGSAHLTDPDAGVFSSPILGGMIPVALGAALSFQMDGSNQVAVAMLGDAAIEEGVFAESINLAVVKKLPVLFVCENNGLSTATPLEKRQPASSITERVRTPELMTVQIDGNYADKVHRTAFHLIEQCRQGLGPAFMECMTYRVREHVGPLYDYDRGYRSKEEVESWIEQCPVKRLSADLIYEKKITQEEIDQLSQSWEARAQEAYAKALNDPWPEAKQIMEHVY